jgi:AcrR family transcriptional regulator
MAKLPPADRRAYILAGAGRVFLEQGFAGASIGDIARAGAGSKGTLYTYFSSKEEMFEEFMVAEIQARATVTFELPERTDDPARTLRDLGTRYLELITEPTVSSLLRVVIAEAVRFPKIGQVFNEVGPRTARAKLTDFLGRCVADGQLVIDEATLPMASSQFLRLCQVEILQEFLMGVRPAPSRAEIQRTVDAAVAMFMATYGSDRRP